MGLLLLPLLFGLVAVPVFSAPGEHEGESPAALQPEPEPAPYVLQAGDEIEVRAFNIPELQDTVSIRPDGKVSLLLVDEVEAAGLTTSQLDEILTARYSQFYIEPRITVIVRSFSSQVVYVGGEVNSPGLIPLQGNLTVTGAVFRAGGFRDTGKMKSVVLLRNAGKPEPAFLTVNMKEILTEGAPDVVLRPFDVVFVPKTAIAKADQFVSQYIRQLLPIATSFNFSYLLGDRTVTVNE